MLPGIGVFGTGAVVKVLVPLLREKGFTVEAIWGRTSKEAAECANQLKIQFYTNKIDDVLLRKDVDLVFIICPPYLHSQISVKALGIGKHVVCDRPMGLGQPDALKMVRAAQYYPSLISLVNYSLRFLPAFLHLKNNINDGYIGPKNEIHLINVRVEIGSLLHDKFDWLCDATMGGGVLNLVGSHVIDLVSYIIEKRATSVHGIIRTHSKSTNTLNGIRQITAPDFCDFQMTLEGGCLVTASLHSNISTNTFIQEVLVCGRDGHLRIRNSDLFGRRDNLEQEETIYLDVHDLNNSLPISDIVLPRPYIKGLCKMVKGLRESFVPEQSNWIKEPVKSAATFEDGLYVQAVIDAIRKSNENRAWTQVSIMTESPTNLVKLINAARISAVVMH